MFDIWAMKIHEGENGIFKNPEDAIKYAKETNFKNEITVYDIKEDKAYIKTEKIYQYIKEYNKGKPLDDQILPTCPFKYRGILGCLGVVCYSISMGTYKRNRECIALFTGYNESVLDTQKESACVRPGLKALSSLALMDKMIHS